MITHTETIPKQSQAQVTLTARLRLPAGADKRSDITETRLRQDIERLHSRRPPDIGPSAGAPVTAVTLESSGKGKARHRKFKEGAESPKKKAESGANGGSKEGAGKEAKKGKADKKAKKNEAEQAEQQKVSAGEQAQDKEEGEQPSETKEGTKGGKDGDSGSDES